MTNILRWIAIPFASVLALLIVNFIATLFVGANNISYGVYTGQEPLSITTMIVQLVKDGIVGASFVYAGAYTAPRYNKNVAIVLATILGVLSAFNLVLAVQTDLSLVTILGIIATIIGAVYAAANTENTETN